MELSNYKIRRTLIFIPSKTYSHIYWDTLHGDSIVIDKIGEVSILGNKEIKINNFNSDGICVIKITVSNKLGKKESVLTIKEKVPDEPNEGSTSKSVLGNFNKLIVNNLMFLLGTCNDLDLAVSFLV